MFYQCVYLCCVTVCVAGHCVPTQVIWWVSGTLQTSERLTLSRHSRSQALLRPYQSRLSRSRVTNRLEASMSPCKSCFCFKLRHGLCLYKHITRVLLKKYILIQLKATLFFCHLSILKCLKPFDLTYVLCEAYFLL